MTKIINKYNSHRKFQSSIWCNLHRQMSDNGRRMDDWWLQHWHKSTRTHFATVANISILRLFGKCFMARRPTTNDEHTASTIFRTLALDSHTEYTHKIFFPFFFAHSQRFVVRAFGSRLCVSSNRFVWRQLEFLFTLKIQVCVCYCCCPICHSVDIYPATLYASTTCQQWCGDE